MNKKIKAKAEYKKLVDAGICTRCKKVKAEDKHVLCIKCMEDKRIRRQKQRKLNLCQECKNKTDGKNALCEACLKKRANRNKIKIQECQNVKLCIRCKENKTDKGNSLCVECAEKISTQRKIKRQKYKDSMICQGCGKVKTTNGNTYCDDCHEKRLIRVRIKNGVKSHIKTCDWCGKAFITFISRKNTCSERCGTDLHRSLNNHEKRVKYYGGKYIEHVDITKLFFRDNGHCKICGKKLNLKRKFPHSLAITIDHIIPVSKKGEHSYRNVQLACLACNMQKGNRTIESGEQLKMFG